MLRACIRRAPKVPVPVKLMSSVELPPPPPPPPPTTDATTDVVPLQEVSNVVQKEESIPAPPKARKVAVKETPRIPSQKVSYHLDTC